MFSSEVARKYAKALFLSVKSRNLVDETYEQFQTFRTLVDDQRGFLSLLAGPTIPVQEKTALVRRVFGDQLNRLHVEFLAVLIRKRRIRFLPEIIDELVRLSEEEKGISRATVIAAVDFSQTDEERLVRQLEAKTGDRVLLDKKIDPSVMGGMIVLLHNEIIDGSVRHGLDLLREHLAKLRVH
jgi:F-type H+-transporting ATPase subunit delta